MSIELRILEKWMGKLINFPRRSDPQADNIEQLLGRLRIFSESDRTDIEPPSQTALDITSPLFHTVAMVVNLGLSMLETEVGKSRIADIGREIISRRQNFDHIYEDHPRNMGWWVELFLVRLRTSFVSVILTNRIGGEGQVSKSNWARDGSRMRQWDPTQAGLLKLNKMVSHQQFSIVEAGLAS
jgi:hypothetical protein